MWNAVGIIKQFNTEEEESIDIEFHNTAIHHAMHLTNSAGYTMGDVSTEAVVLASPGEDSDPRSAQCLYSYLICTMESRFFSRRQLVSVLLLYM